MLLLLSICGLLYWINDPLILFCRLYRWSFKAAVKCAIKSSRQLTGLIYKQMQPVINKRLKWSNGRASFHIKSSNLLSLCPQPSEALTLQDTGLWVRKWLLFPLFCINCFCTHQIHVWKPIPQARPLLIHPGGVAGVLAQGYVQVSHVVQLCWSCCNSRGCFPGTPRNQHSSHLPGCYKQGQECFKRDVKIANTDLRNTVIHFTPQ